MIDCIKNYRSPFLPIMNTHKVIKFEKYQNKMTKIPKSITHFPNRSLPTLLDLSLTLFSLILSLSLSLIFNFSLLEQLLKYLLANSFVLHNSSHIYKFLYFRMNLVYKSYLDVGLRSGFFYKIFYMNCLN